MGGKGETFSFAFLFSFSLSLSFSFTFSFSFSLAFFFFKQKTAYEIMPSLVGSEMCIRDRCSSPFMRLAQHLKALRAWCKLCLPGR